MRLLIITQYFPPEMGASQTRLFELSSRLKELGFDITILTAMPNYPTGKIFDTYRWKVRMTEQINGMKVVRTCVFPSISKRFFPRLVSYFSFALSSLVLGIWGLGKQDIVLVDSPPPFIVPTSMLISKIKSSKLVMMVADIWPDIIIRMGHASQDSLSVKAMLWLEKFCYNHSDVVSFSNPAACDQIRERFPNLKNITVISNGVDTEMFSPNFASQETRKKYGATTEDFLVAYCGLHGMAQGLEVVLEAAKKLELNPKIKFIMVGDGPTKEGLVRKADEMQVKNLTFYDRVPKKEMPTIIASADVSLVTLSGRFPGTMPSKAYEAFASGTPPIVAKGCEAEPLINNYNSGRTYEPGNPQELADAIKELAGDRNLYNMVRENAISLSNRFDRKKVAARTEQILQAIAHNETLPAIDW